LGVKGEGSGSRVVCNACRFRLGSVEGAEGRGCAACQAWREQAAKESRLWIEREVDARRVGECCKRFRGPGKGAVGKLLLDYGWCRK